MRSRLLRRVATFTAIATAAVLIAGPSAAQAATSACYDNEKTIALPGKPDVWVGVELCIYHTSADRRVASLDLTWDGAFLGGKRFDSFRVQIRIERYDTDFNTAWCNFTEPINIDPSSGYSHWYCSTAYTSTADGGWSADGKVVYNVNNDGQGNKTWQLHGTPLIT